MSYLLRVELPDVPGSLGRLASAIGSVGGNINAIEIVERGPVTAVDDVFVEPDPNVMPDTIVSACQRLDGVRVLWISRYAAGGNLFLDLEAVEAMTDDPAHATNRLVDGLPDIFRVDWAMRVRHDGETLRPVHGTVSAPDAAPAGLAWPGRLKGGRRFELAAPDDELLVAGSPLGKEQLILVARRGGPPILDSEIARLDHLAALAFSISR